MLLPSTKAKVESGTATRPVHLKVEILLTKAFTAVPPFPDLSLIKGRVGSPFPYRWDEGMVWLKVEREGYGRYWLGEARQVDTANLA